MKNLDWQARRVVFEAKATDGVLTEVPERVSDRPSLEFTFRPGVSAFILRARV